MKIIILFLISLISLSAQAPKAKQADNDNHQLWTKLSATAFSNKEFFANTKKTDPQLVKSLEDSFSQLINEKSLIKSSHTFKMKKLGVLRQQAFHAVINNLEQKYGHTLSLEMIGLGTNFISQHGFKVPETVTLTHHLPTAEHKQVANILDETKELIAVVPLKFEINDETPNNLLWIRLVSKTNDLRDCVSIIERGDADPVIATPLVKDIENTMKIMVKKQLLEAKTYQFSINKLSPDQLTKLKKITLPLVPNYGLSTHEMTATGMIMLFYKYVPQPGYNPDQFTVYLPQPQFEQATKLLDSVKVQK